MLEAEDTPIRTEPETRAERKARLLDESNTQVELDELAIDELEQQFGDSNISVVKVPYTPGLPVCCAVRTPKKVELKRFRATIAQAKSKDAAAEQMASITATEELGLITCVYPDKDTLTKLIEARPNLPVDLGRASSRLAHGANEAEGKG